MAADPRLICASGDLIDGGSGVRFTVMQYGRDEPAFVVRFRGQVFAYSTAAVMCRSNSTGSTTSFSMIPSYT